MVFDLLRFCDAIIYFLSKEIFYSSIMFAFIFGITFIFKRLSPLLRYGLWFLVLLRLILPPDLTLSMSGRNMINHLPVMSTIFHSIADFLSENGMSGESHFTGYSIHQQQSRKIVNTNESDHQMSRYQILHLLLVMGWLLGIVILIKLYLNRLFKIRRLIRESNQIDSFSVQNLVNQWRTEFNIRRNIEIRSSDKFLSPFTSGLFKPIVYIPHRMLISKDMDLLHSIVAHEMAHIKRLDHLWIQLQNIIQILYFFHPVVWIANSQINLLRECLCDNYVLSSSSISLNSYGNSLLAVLKMNLFGAEEFNLLPLFGSHRKKIIHRLKNLNGGYQMSTFHKLAVYFLIIIVATVFLPMAKQVVIQSDTRGNFKLTAAEPQNKAAQDKRESDAISTDEITFIKPVRDGRISAPFGKMIHPIKKEEVFHVGIDIAATVGTEVYAAADGAILKAVNEYEPNVGPGRHILVEHQDGYQTFYSHLDTVLVSENQKVKSGEVIGRVGSTGISTGPHLHYELRLNGENKDPQKYIRFDETK